MCEKDAIVDSENGRVSEARIGLERGRAADLPSSWNKLSRFSCRNRYHHKKNTVLGPRDSNTSTLLHKKLAYAPGYILE